MRNITCKNCQQQEKKKMHLLHYKHKLKRIPVWSLTATGYIQRDLAHSAHVDPVESQLLNKRSRFLKQSLEISRSSLHGCCNTARLKNKNVTLISLYFLLMKKVSNFPSKICPLRLRFEGQDVVGRPPPVPVCPTGHKESCQTCRSAPAGQLLPLTDPRTAAGRTLSGKPPAARELPSSLLCKAVWQTLDQIWYWVMLSRLRTSF